MQAAEASTAPWRFVPDGSAGEMTRFRSDLGALGIGDADKICTITGAIDPGMGLSGFRTVMIAWLSIDEGSPLIDANSVYWLIAPNESDEQYVMSLKVSDETGRNLATLWVQNRASLSR